MKHYRLVEKTTVTGFKLWVVQKKTFLAWLFRIDHGWEYVDSYIDKEKARMAFAALSAGQPEHTIRVLDQT